VLGGAGLAQARDAANSASHKFSATYTGHGSGQVSGTSASGSATASGHGNLLGTSTMSGSARGTVTSPTCVSFSGTATLKGAHGTFILSAHDAEACAGSTSSGDVGFSGNASVTRGTGTFAGAHGTLAFRGAYTQATSQFTITFTGRIVY
jgi:hypothetical protein